MLNFVITETEWERMENELSKLSRGFPFQNIYHM